MRKDIEINNLSIISSNIKLPNINGLFDVYKIEPIKLQFNPFNDRFAKEFHDYEKRTNKKLGFDKDSQIYIYKQLSALTRNKITKKDIIKNGLLRNIVIDITGTVIDGNRRLSIILDILHNSKKDIAERFKFINVVIVPRKLTKDEIEDYETKLQISEDEKLPYDAINISLKINKYLKKFKNEGKGKYRKVSNLMGINYTVPNIKEEEDMFIEMEAYLSHYSQNKNYLLLEKKSDQFKNISKFRKNFNKKKLKTNYDLTFSNYKRVMNILYVFLSLGLRANPNFRKLIPSTDMSKSPLSRLEGIEMLEKYINDNSLDNFTKKHTSKPNKIFNNEILQSAIKTVNEELNDSNPSVKYQKLIFDSEKKMKKLYEAVNKKQVRQLSNDEKKSIDNIITFINSIKKGINNEN